MDTIWEKARVLWPDRREQVLDPSVVFSDIDGTLVHYKDALIKQGYQLVKDCEPSSMIAPTTLEDDEDDQQEYPYHHGYLKNPEKDGLVPSERQRVHLLKNPPEIGVWRHIETGEEIECFRVPSATLGGGYISCRTLYLVDAIRAHDIKFVIITGARSSTWELRRLMGTVPRADIDVTEGGGKVWHQTYPDAHLETIQKRMQILRGDEGGSGNTVDHENLKFRKDSVLGVMPLAKEIDLGNCINSRLDEDWLDRFKDDVGDWRTNSRILDPLQRTGRLWDLYRELSSSYASVDPPPKLDPKHYVSAMLMDYRGTLAVERERTNQQGGEDFDVKIRQRFSEELGTKYNARFCTNLGKAHISPKTLSKATVAHYIAEEVYGLKEEPMVSAAEDTLLKKKKRKTSMEQHCVALFDDENDLEFAAACGIGFMPSVSHPRVLEALKLHGGAQGTETAESRQRAFKDEMDRRERELLLFAADRSRRRQIKEENDGLLDLDDRDKRDRQRMLRELEDSVESTNSENCKWFRATHDGLLGTEEALERILRMKLQCTARKAVDLPAKDNASSTHVENSPPRSLQLAPSLSGSSTSSPARHFYPGAEAPPLDRKPQRGLSSHLQQWVSEELLFSCFCTSSSSTTVPECKHEELHLETKMFNVEVLQILRDEQNEGNTLMKSLESEKVAIEALLDAREQQIENTKVKQMVDGSEEFAVDPW